MSKLNERTEKTEKVIHLMVTTLCGRNCPHCCNKQYDLNDVAYVTDEELRTVKAMFITGGEPFAFASPCNTARYYRRRYPNIKQICVYTNAIELAQYLRDGGQIHSIDGVNISLKCKADVTAFTEIILKDERITSLPNNYLYVFDNLYDGNPTGFTTFNRKWQADFTPADDSIFRKI